MNWLLLIIGIVLLLHIVRGVKRGFVRVIFSLLGLVLVLGFGILMTPHVSNFLMNQTAVSEKIEEKCLENIENKAQEKISSQTNSVEGILGELGLQLPGSVENGVTQAVQDGVNQALEDSGIYEQLAVQIAHAIVNGIAFLISIIIGAILLAIIRAILEHLMDLPGLKTVNRVMGLVAGLIQGLVVSWVILYLIGIIGGFDTSGTLMAMVQESKLLTFLYENNLLVTVLSAVL